MKKRFKKVVGYLLEKSLDGIDWIYKNQPEGTVLTEDDKKNIAEVKRMRAMLRSKK